MSKKVIVVFIAIIVFVGSYFVISQMNKPKVTEGNKTINLTITNQLTDEVYFDDAVRTDALLLGDLLDELVENNKIEIEFAGNRDDIYGRYIVAINNINSSDAYWIINSDNNEQCISDGYCSGIDSQPINDNDNFSIDLSNGY